MVDQATLDASLAALTAKVDKVLAALQNQVPSTPDTVVTAFQQGVDAQTARLPE